MADTATVQSALSSARAHHLQQGMRQLTVVKALMDRRVEHGGGDMAAALNAARHTARFIAREGWITGPAWSAYGAQWLLEMWALRHGHTWSDVLDAWNEARAGAADAQPANEDAADQARKAARKRRAAHLRRGAHQVDALHTLLHHLATDATVPTAARAAQRAASFAGAEGWARGPLWSAAGMQMLLSRWALGEAVTFDQLVDHFGDSQARAAMDDQEGQS